ncbi:hypothetical protein AQUCO_00100126v1 [Aquilegia coerulea]|uniref:SF4 helicase domain-containing protein n=1 Tax=Aquilegia coerulea TaxID=218851 RepID=A0A2G5F8U9_AQUCA|nr:hypothetical protein AQUCO_00100126v1 [Aquilegia coerulea]
MLSLISSSSSSSSHRSLINKILLFHKNSKSLLKYTPCPCACCISTCSLHSYDPSPQLFKPYPSLNKPTFLLQFSLTKRALSYHAYSPNIPAPVQLENQEIDTLESASARYLLLKKKLEAQGIMCDSCRIGVYNRLKCPQCESGDSRERSFSLYITPDADLAMWQCFRGKCGWRGHVRALDSGKSTYSKTDEIDKIKRIEVITEESTGLQPLCKEALTGPIKQGASTGWKDLDKLYKIVPGELTIVTGVPNSGKSDWIDALLCNLNEREGWKFALCSMENKVREHARKLLEKHIRKPFFTASYSGTVERMDVEEFERGKEWLDDTFHLIRCEDDCLPSITWVLNLAKAAVFRHGVRGLLIDSYNELDHRLPSNQTETEYVSQMLTMIKCFAQHHSCHVWFVAHPQQLHQWLGGPPNLYDISGSAHFINKCDNEIVVHCNRNPEAGPVDQVQICVRKVRNNVAGSIGDALLSYNRITGEFHDLDEPARRQSEIIAPKLAKKPKS